jgi:hypothetical protein
MFVIQEVITSSGFRRAPTFSLMTASVRMRLRHGWRSAIDAFAAARVLQSETRLVHPDPGGLTVNTTRPANSWRGREVVSRAHG